MAILAVKKNHYRFLQKKYAMILSNCQKASCINLEPANQTRRKNFHFNPQWSSIKQIFLLFEKFLHSYMEGPQKNKQSKNQIILDLSFIYGFINIYGASYTKARKNLRCNFFFDPSGVRL